MPPAFEVLLLNTAVPQIQAAQSGDTYVVPRDIAFSAALTLSAGTANGVPYLDGSKVLTSGSALTFDGTRLEVLQSGVSSGGSVIRVYNTSDGIGAGQLQIAKFGSAASYGPYSANTVGINAASTSLLLGTETNNPVIFYQNNTEQMRLTSTGLGIGTSSPSAKLHVSNGATTNPVAGNAVAAFQSSANAVISFNTPDANAAGLFFGYGGNAYWAGIERDGATGLRFVAGGNEMRLDSSGNLGLGVTPSAWGSGWTALQVGSRTVVHSAPDGRASFGGNYYVDGTNARYIASAEATQLMQVSGQFRFYTAPSGTAGDAITFTQAMTLDASGRLGIGVTNPSVGLVVAYNTDGIIGNYYSSSGNNSRISFSNASLLNNNVSIGSASDALVMYTGAAEKARITSGGAFVMGTSPSSGAATNNNYLTVRGDTDTTATNYTTYILYNNSNLVFGLKNDGYVRADGIYSKTSGSAANVYVDSDGLLYRSTSSLKYKTDVHDASHGLAEVMQLRSVMYKSTNENDGETIFGGLIAEEVHAAGLTEFVQYAPDGSPDALAYGNMVSLLVKAIQEQQAMINELKAEVAALKGA